MLYAYHLSFFSPFDFDPLVTFFAYVIVIFAGAGSYWGVPVGALLFGGCCSRAPGSWIWPLSGLESAERAWLRLIVIGLLLILLVAFRPQGLFGKRGEMVLE